MEVNGKKTCRYYGESLSVVHLLLFLEHENRHATIAFQVPKILTVHMFRARMKEQRMKMKEYAWYLELRKYVCAALSIQFPCFDMSTLALMKHTICFSGMVQYRIQDLEWGSNAFCKWYIRHCLSVCS